MTALQPTQQASIQSTTGRPLGHPYAASRTKGQRSVLIPLLRQPESPHRQKQEDSQGRPQGHGACRRHGSWSHRNQGSGLAGVVGVAHRAAPKSGSRVVRLRSPWPGTRRGVAFRISIRFGFRCGQCRGLLLCRPRHYRHVGRLIFRLDDRTIGHDGSPIQPSPGSPTTTTRPRLVVHLSRAAPP
jgi:hypothetical protein